jgi:hypothetical protein
VAKACQGNGTHPRTQEIQGNLSFVEAQEGIRRGHPASDPIELLLKGSKTSPILFQGPKQGISFPFEKGLPSAHRLHLLSQQQQLLSGGGKGHG